MTNYFSAQLTPSTLDLVERYADFDEGGYIKNYQIINKELIEALVRAGEWLKTTLSEGEEMAEVWSRPNPCDECPEKGDCTITCRRKHSFDKEVYGGLLCGTLPAAESSAKGKNGAKNKVHFKVRLFVNIEGEKGLYFERNEEYAGEALEVNKKGEILLRGKALNLRPWSASLYTMFCLHPEGITLSSLYTEHTKEFVKIYKKFSASEIKTKKFKAQLADLDSITRLLNNKLSELNTQLRSLGVEPQFLVTATAHKANNKPYFIPYLKEQK